MIFNKFYISLLLAFNFLIFASCGGGDEEVVNAERSNTAGNTKEETLPSVEDTKTD